MNEFLDRPFVVIDLDSGSYLNENEGHEKHNEVENPVTGKFYGYAPPYGKIDITKLGAKKKDTSASGVMVIYVRKEEKSNNRYISSFIPDATVYSSPIIDKSLNRLARKRNKLVHCSYCIESDVLVSVPTSAQRFTIILKEHSVWMFRKQRFYKGRYPDLDKKMVAYIESLSSLDLEPDDAQFQHALQASPEVTPQEMAASATQKPTYSNGSHGQQVYKRVEVSKAALASAKYRCEADPMHSTFLTRKGVPYMEGHHLIPCTAMNSRRFWKGCGVNIDCLENIVSLCPTCHRLLHYGDHKVRHEVLATLYSKRQQKLQAIGIHISLEELELFY